jgi:hypothetical protein
MFKNLLKKVSWMPLCLALFAIIAIYCNGNSKPEVPALKKSAITVTEPDADGFVQVIGAPGAVNEKYLNKEIVLKNTSQLDVPKVSIKPNSDGSFSARIKANKGDVLALWIKGLEEKTKIKIDTPSGGEVPQPVCGNGKCETGENGTSCAEDCKPAGCLGEGESFNATGKKPEELKECCEGLVKINKIHYEPSAIPECKFPKCECYVCTRCGDGICGKGENFCNCSEDCPPGSSGKDCADHKDYESCSKDSNCMWLAPGCGEKPLPKALTGCHSKDIVCNTEDDCDTGYTCQTVSIMPRCALECNPEGPCCEACGREGQLCIPIPLDKWTKFTCQSDSDCSCLKPLYRCGGKWSCRGGDCYYTCPGGGSYKGDCHESNKENCCECLEAPVYCPVKWQCINDGTYGESLCKCHYRCEAGGNY